VLALCVPGLAAERVEVVETFPEAAIGGVDWVDYMAGHAHLQSWLLSELPSGSMDKPVQIRVTAADLRELERVDAEDPGKTVVGLTKPVSQPVDFSGLKLDAVSASAKGFAGGSVAATDDGGFVWATSVVSKGASALRVHFTDVKLPPTADLFVYTLEGQAFGPYQSDVLGKENEFWSNTVVGSTAIVQLRYYGPAVAKEIAQIGFKIADVGHIGPKFLPAGEIKTAFSQSRPDASSKTADGVDFQVSDPASDPSTDQFCSYNASCIENAECGGPGWSAKADAQNATALMLWVSGAFINTCTGGLLNDTASSGTPYFLTANHCLSRNKDARNLETYFQYKVSCGGSCPSEWQGGGIQRSGSTLLSTSNTSDYTLLQLNQAPPSGSVFMGWTSAPVANSNGTDLYRISHPATAPQAYSAQTVDTSAGTCQGIPRGAWIYSGDTYGATEGGSSGSPVYNGNGQVVGQLTGACGFNPGDPCDSGSNATIDGAFANYYSNISQYLNPSPCDPSPEVCDDNDDNDCDGDVDCDDADCSGDPACDTGGCSLGQPGDPCTSNGDCCSNKCKGPPSGKTCR
jgi:V8-like Glu-specific endopeptidase